MIPIYGFLSAIIRLPYPYTEISAITASLLNMLGTGGGGLMRGKEKFPAKSPARPDLDVIQGLVWVCVL